MKRLFFAALFFAFSSSAWAWSSTTCAPGQIDVLAWMTPGPGNPNTHQHGRAAGGQMLPRYHNMWSNLLVETNQDVGYPWDIVTYDNNYIYWWITGTDASYTDPTTYTAFDANTNKKAPRCYTPNSSWSSGLQSPYLKYVGHGCQLQWRKTWQTISEVLGPYTISFGGSIPANSKALLIANYWDDGSGSVRSIREDNYYVEGYGLVLWNMYKLNGTNYDLVYSSRLTTKVAGGMPAYSFPCTP